jgi:hypothetical protein
MKVKLRGYPFGIKKRKRVKERRDYLIGIRKRNELKKKSIKF